MADLAMAEKRPVSASSPNSEKADRYGFVMETEGGAGTQFGRQGRAEPTPEQIRIENERAKKWLTMLDDWEEFVKAHPKKLKQRLVKGIPDNLRGMAWKVLTNSDELMESNRGKYEQLCAVQDVPLADTIARDIHRTFPDHVMFRGGKDSVGQTSLHQLLRAYSVHDTQVGYCQGMGYVSGMFLSYMPEEEAFWLLVAVMSGGSGISALQTPMQHASSISPELNMRSLYMPTMPKVMEMMWVSEKLLQRYMPRLARHLLNENATIGMYGTKWFVTVYSRDFPFEIVTRIWDIFFVRGWKIVYRVMLALHKIHETALRKMGMEEIMGTFRDVHVGLTIDKLLSVAACFPLKTKLLDALVHEYEETLKQDQ